jgi:hypothetical protein
VNATSEIKSDTTALRDDTAVRHKHVLIRWICPVGHHVQQRDFIDRHQTGTGKWFLQDTKFQDWDRSKDATLFCPGTPSDGKPIKAALIIDHLLRNQHVADEPITFIYCNLCWLMLAMYHSDLLFDFVTDRVIFYIIRQRRSS